MKLLIASLILISSVTHATNLERACHCKEELLGNEYCNPECNNVYCNWDGYDCTKQLNQSCAFISLSSVGCTQVQCTSNFYNPVDEIQLDCNSKLYAIRIMWDLSYKLMALSFIYENNGDYIVSPWHGNENQIPTLQQQNEHILQSNEFIVKVTTREYLYYSYIEYLRLETNLGRVIEYGNASPTYDIVVPIPYNSYIIAFNFRARKSVEFLEFYAPADPTANCLCGPQDLGDGICTQLCNIEACNFDGGDCDNWQQEYHQDACACDRSLIQNGYCNEECNTFECNYDGKDCLIESNGGCQLGKFGYIGNKEFQNPFNDIIDFDISCDSKIKGINIGIVNNYYISLQVVYEVNGETVISPWHGGSAPTNPTSYTFDEGEEIVKIQSWAETYIEKLTLTTNTDRVITAGFYTSDYKEIVIPAGLKLKAFGGGVNTNLQNLQLYVAVGDTANNSEQCLCDQSLLGNSVCDNQCNYAQCDYDGKDCLLQVQDDCYLRKADLLGRSDYTGTEFNDITSLGVQCNWRITEFFVFFNSQLYAFGFKYWTGTEEVVTQTHNTNYLISSQYIVHHQLQPRELITGFEVSGSQNLIQYLKLTTNLGRDITYGYNSAVKKYDAKIPQGSYLLGISGITNNSGQFKLTAYYPAYPKQNCGCSSDWLGDGICTQICNTEGCGFDGGDCEGIQPVSEYAPVCQCNKKYIQNGNCDSDCNNEACYFDGLDCAIESSVGCKFLQQGKILYGTVPVSFNDIQELGIGCDWKLSAIEVLTSITSPYIITGLRTEYTKANGEKVQSPIRGNNGSSSSYFRRKELAPNEFITQVKYYTWSGSIYSLFFKTNLGRQLFFGQDYNGVATINFVKGTHLAALSGGGDGVVLKNLDFYTFTGQSNVCECLPEALDDGICTNECKAPACNYDAADCAKEPLYSEEDLAFCNCDLDLVQNGVCNLECANSSCFYDAQECVQETQAGCKVAKIYQYGIGNMYLDTAFSDPIDLNFTCNYKITQVQFMYYSYEIKGLRVTYLDLNSGQQVQTSYHSTTSPASTTIYTFDLQDNEFITNFRIYSTLSNSSSKRIYGIQLKTNYYRTFNAGYQNDKMIVDIPIERGSVLIGFGGYFSTTITQLDFYVYTDPSNGCLCSAKALGNGFCQEQCNTAGCNYDEGDCIDPKSQTELAPYCGCDEWLFGNGTCDEGCDGLACNWDNFDCVKQIDTCSYGIGLTVGGTYNTDLKFNDIQSLNLSCTSRLSGLDIYWYSSRLGSLRAIYEDNGQTIVGPWYGQNISSTFVQHRFVAGEYITRLRITHYNDTTYSLLIETNLGQNIPYGTDKGAIIYEFGGNQDYQIVGLGGTTNASGTYKRLNWILRVDTSVQERNYCSCEASKIGDGTCNKECNNAACNWDGLDCTVESYNQCKFVEVGKIGQKTGTLAFNHIKDLGIDCHWRIRAIQLKWISQVLKVIRFEYDMGGTHIQSIVHTIPNTDVTGATEYLFEPHEFIKVIRGNYDSTYEEWRYLYIRTNLGKVIEFGTNYGQYFDISLPKGYYLAALSGQFSDTKLYNLTFYAIAQPELYCACGSSTGHDGICTEMCNKEVCGFDGGECDEQVNQALASPFCTCDLDLVHNGSCNTECNNSQCLSDGGDCNIYSKGCNYGLAKTIGIPQVTTEFNDIKELKIGCDWKISALYITPYSSYISRIRVKYQNYDGLEYLTPWRGSSTETKYDTYIFEHNEYIIRVDGDANSYGISSLLIETNLGRVISYNYYYSNYTFLNYFSLPKGQYVAALGGFADTSYIYALNVYVNLSGNIPEIRANAQAKRYSFSDWKLQFYGYEGYNGPFTGIKSSSTVTDSQTPNVPEGYGKYNRDGSFNMSSVNELLYCTCGLPNIGNGTCDTSCFNFECGYDGGDCGKFVIGCACPVAKLGDGICDSQCNTPTCIFDKGDCQQYPKCQCDSEQLGNGECDIACFNENCGFDDGDCGTPIEGCECPASWLGNGSCNQLCNTDACGYDNGDCNLFPKCKCDVSKIRDNVCDVECFNRDCIYDGGDCGVPYQDCPCPRMLLLNGVCDKVCNVEGCLWDNGACQ